MMWDGPWKVAVGAFATLALLSFSCDDSPSVPTNTDGTAFKSQVENLQLARITTAPEVETGLKTVGGGIEGYTSLVQKLLGTALHFVPSVEGFGATPADSSLPFMAEEDAVPAAAAAAEPAVPAQAAARQAASECYKIDSQGSFKTANGAIEGRVTATADFGQTSCAPKDMKDATAVGKFNLELDARKEAGSWKFRFEGFKLFDKSAKVVLAADGTIEIEWTGRAIPLVTTTPPNDGKPSETVTNIDVKGIDTGRNLSVRGKITVDPVTSKLYETSQDLEVVEGGITHYITGSAIVELVSGKDQMVGPTGVPEVVEGEESKLRVEQRLDYANTFLGRFTMESHGVILSSLCAQNPVDGVTSIVSDAGAIRITYHEACDGKATLAINDVDSGEVGTTRLQPVATTPKR